jgi:hypothetical protein
MACDYTKRPEVTAGQAASFARSDALSPALAESRLSSRQSCLVSPGARVDSRLH